MLKQKRACFQSKILIGLIQSRDCFPLPVIGLEGKHVTRFWPIMERLPKPSGKIFSLITGWCEEGVLLLFPSASTDNICGGFKNVSASSLPFLLSIWGAISPILDCELNLMTQF